MMGRIWEWLYWVTGGNYWNTAMTKNLWSLVWLVLVLVITTCLDCLGTIYGLQRATSAEVNHIYLWYMQVFGLREGIIYFKFIMLTLNLIGISLIEWVWVSHHDQRRMVLNLTVLGGAICYAWAGLTWVVLLIKNHL